MEGEMEGGERVWWLEIDSTEIFLSRNRDLLKDI